MEKFVRHGQLAFAVAVMGFGAQQLVYAVFGHAVAFIIPWVPDSRLWAYPTGIALLAAGLSIATNIRARVTATVLGVFLLLVVLSLHVPRMAAHPLNISIRSCAFETLAICGSALTLAATGPVARQAFRRFDGVLDELIKSGPLLFAFSSVVFGIDHLLVPRVIAGLVPTWIPGGLFWAYCTAAVFIVSGVCIAAAWMAGWAATVLGTMFLLWLVVLHAPRVVSAPHNPNEWSSAFIALGMCGGSWICARNALQAPHPSTA